MLSVPFLICTPRNFYIQAGLTSVYPQISTQPKICNFLQGDLKNHDQYKMLQCLAKYTHLLGRCTKAITPQHWRYCLSYHESRKTKELTNNSDPKEVKLPIWSISNHRNLPNQLGAIGFVIITISSVKFPSDRLGVFLGSGLKDHFRAQWLLFLRDGVQLSGCAPLGRQTNMALPFVLLELPLLATGSHQPTVCARPREGRPEASFSKADITLLRHWPRN